MLHFCYLVGRRGRTALNKALCLPSLFWYLGVEAVEVKSEKQRNLPAGSLIFLKAYHTYYYQGGYCCRCPKMGEYNYQSVYGHRVLSLPQTRLYFLVFLCLTLSLFSLLNETGSVLCRLQGGSLLLWIMSCQTVPSDTVRSASVLGYCSLSSFTLYFIINYVRASAIF